MMVIVICLPLAKTRLNIFSGPYFESYAGIHSWLPKPSKSAMFQMTRASWDYIWSHTERE